MTAALLPPVAALLAAAAVGLVLPPDPVARLVRSSRRRPRALAGRAGAVLLPGFRRVRTAGTGPVPAPVVVDLVAAALLTGLPPDVAVGTVADVLDEAGDPGGPALRCLVRPSPAAAGAAGGAVPGSGGGAPVPGPPPAAFAELADALDLAVRTGLGPVGLVQAAAGESRRRAAARRQVAARRLGTLVVLPTGLCLLPAFVLLTVAPLVLDLLFG